MTDEIMHKTFSSAHVTKRCNEHGVIVLTVIEANVLSHGILSTRNTEKTFGLYEADG